MNKLINRISPETSENRILHAGFSIILMSEEITQTLSGLSSDMIIFILSGSITIYSTKEEKKTIGEQYMIFLRSFENYTYDITLGSKIIIFFFDSLTMNEFLFIILMRILSILQFLRLKRKVKKRISPKHDKPSCK